MSYLSIDASATDTLALPSEQATLAAATVQMKRVASYGDVTAAQGAMIKLSATAGTEAAISDIEWGAYISTLVCRLVTSWNLTDAAGVVLPINAQSIELLNQEDGAFLAAEAQKRAGGRPAAQQTPFVSPSSSSSSATQESSSPDTEQTPTPSES